MNFWNKELPDELNQIAQIQQQPFLQTYNYNRMSNSNNNNNNYDNGNSGGTTAIYPKRYGTKLDVITGHMNKFGTRDNGAEDPVRTLKLLLQEPYAGTAQAKENQAENMYNAPPSTQHRGIVMQGESEEGEDNDNVDIKAPGYEVRYNGFTKKMSSSYTTRSPYNTVYGSRQFNTHFSGTGEGGDVMGYDGKYFDVVAKTNTGNYVNEDNNKLSGDEAGDNEEHVAKSETTLHLLIGLIIVFIILNVIIYSTFLLQKKKKTKTMQRKLGGGGILSYDGTTDDDLKRSKTNTTQPGDDGDDSFIMDTMRKSNTYEQVKTERSPINGYKITRQLSCSTVDTHTKVSEWITTTEPHKQATLQRRPSSSINSKKSSSFTSSLRGSGSFGKPSQPCKVSVAIDATPEGRGSCISEQEPIEITKMKQDGRNIIICQDIEVEDQELLTPQDSLDNSRYTLARQHSAVTETCDTELIQPMHQHSRSDPVEMYYQQNEKVTSFISNEDNDLQDINVTSKDDDYDIPAEILTAEQQLNVIKRRKYPKVLPTFMQYERETDSPPMTKDLSTTYKRNSLPPNSYFPHFAQGKQQPPQPPPRTVATLGRKPSPGRRNSNIVTTSPLMVAHDYAEEEEEEPEITENTLIVGSLKPTEGYYSTLRRENKPANLNTQTNSYKQTATETAASAAGVVLSAPALLSQQQSVFQSFESHPPSHETPEREVAAHLTEKVYCIQPPLTNDKHQASCCNSEPTTPIYQYPQHNHQQLQHQHQTPLALINNDSYKALPQGIVYAQPKKSQIPRVLATPATAPTTLSTNNALIHSTINERGTEMAGGEGVNYSQAFTNNNIAAYSGIDTTNCCQVVTKVPNDNQVSTKETLKTTDINTATTADAVVQTRIPQLQRNANVISLQQQNINIDKTNANLIPKATITSNNNILTAATQKVLSSALTQPTIASETSSLANSLSSKSATSPNTLTSSGFDNCKNYDVPKNNQQIPNPKTYFSNKTSSITSTSSLSSSSSSTSSATSQQTDTNSTTSSTSSSTGTVRTELQQK